jgi:hypothetical protein
MFRVMTLEDRCEFLKLSIESYSKISKVILLFFQSNYFSNKKIEIVRENK